MINIYSKFIYLLFFFMLSANLYSQEAVASEEAITFYTEINHPYVYYKAGTTELTGIAYDIVTEMLNKTDLNAEIEVNPWLRAMRYHKANDNSCLFIMNRTKEREKHFQWIGPLFTGGIAIYKKKDSTKTVHSMNDLKGRTVVGRKDGAALKSIDEKYGAIKIEAHTDEAAAKMFFQERAELWVAGLTDAPLAARFLGLPRPVIAFNVKDVELSMGCSLNLDPRKVKALQKVHEEIKSIKQDILLKYL